MREDKRLVSREIVEEVEVIVRADKREERLSDGMGAITATAQSFVRFSAPMNAIFLSCDLALECLFSGWLN